MIYRDYISWWLRPAFLQPWGQKRSTLFAGPFAGEFGWELLNWQPFLRWLAPQYQSVIVCIRKGNEALYQDFTHRFEYHALRGTSECNSIRDVQNPEELERIKALVPADADWLLPVGWQPESRKVFKVFGTRRPEMECDVVFHPRGRGFGSGRNWPENKWEDLVSRLSADGLRVACIGLRSATLQVAGSYVDRRDTPLHETMDLMASTRLVVGPSSGPMHMASLCRTPHLVWTDTQKYARGHTSRFKYEKHWNPFGTPALVLDQDGFDPSVDTVYHHITEFLATHPQV